MNGMKWRVNSFCSWARGRRAPWGLGLGSLGLLALGACSTPAAIHAPPAPQSGSRPTDDNWVTRAIAGDPYLLAAAPQFTFETLLGTRELDSDRAWAPLDNQLDVGISWQAPFLGFRDPEHWLFGRALSWDFGLHYSYDRSDVSGPIRSGRFVSRSVEASGGVLLEPPDPDWRLRPYVGSGLSILFTDVELEGEIDPFRQRDTTTGGYVRTGARFQWSSRQHFGVDVRWLFGTDAVDGVGASADSKTISFIFGTRF